MTKPGAPTSSSNQEITRSKALLYSLYSFNGRMNRKDFWLKGTLLPLLIYAAGFAATIAAAASEELIANNISRKASTVMPLIAMAIICIAFFQQLISTLAVATKRVHDLGKSETWVLLMFIPIGNIIVSFILGIIPGQNEANKYGDPGIPQPIKPTPTTLLESDS